MAYNIQKTKFQKKCEGCICELLNDSEILICESVFHNNICSIHYKYCNKNIQEKKLYDKCGRNFFVDLVEHSSIKYKIRNPTINFLVERLQNY
jgi:hypothetical protein